MRRAGQSLADDAFDLFQFVHQVQLRRQPAGGIDHDHVDAARLRRMHGVEGDGGRIAGFLCDHGDVVAFAPDRQLLARGGAEGIAGGQQHRLLMRLQMLGQFADGGGFAGAVDARDHHDQRLMLAQHQRLLQRLEQIDQQIAQGVLDLGRIEQLVGFDFFLERFQQKLGGFDAGIGGEQCGFEFFIQIVVYLRADEQNGQIGRGFGQAALQSAQPALLGWKIDSRWSRIFCWGCFGEGRGEFVCRVCHIGRRLRIRLLGCFRLRFFLEETKHRRYVFMGNCKSGWRGERGTIAVRILSEQGL